MGLQMVYIKPEYPTPPNPISTQEDLNTIKYKSLGDQKITNSLLQLLIEWRRFLAQEVN